MPHCLRTYPIFLLFLTFFVGFNGYGQNLIISSSGQTGSSGTNWSISGNTLTATGDANIHPTVIENALTIGSFSVVVMGPKGQLKINDPIISKTNNSLYITAEREIQLNNCIELPGGSIRLSVQKDQKAQGKITINSTIDVSSEEAQAGQIVLEAQNILLSETAELYARGLTGGGNILIGGDWQGGASEERRVFKDPKAVHQATTVKMDQGAIIDASATQNGNGGNVVLWSDINNPNSETNAHGTIYAKGGTFSGDGGYIETSGGILETDEITIATNSKNGKQGLWLLDPYNYVINSNAANNISNALNRSDVTITTSTLTSGYYDSYGTCDECGDIQLNNAISYSGSTDRTLTLKADSSIDINASISSSGSGRLNIILWADKDAKGGNGTGGFIDLAAGVELKSNGGEIVLAGGSDSNGDGIPDGYAWNAKSTSYPGISIGPPYGTGSSVNILSNGGNIILRGKTSNTVGYPGVASAKNFKIDSGNGTIEIDGFGENAHGIELAYGVDANYAITSSSTNNPAISIVGETERDGYTGNVLLIRGGGYLVESKSNTGGGINIQGINSKDTGNKIFLAGDISSNNYILSKNGPINFLTSGGNSNGLVNQGNLVIGKNTSITINSVTSDVSSAVSDVKFTSDHFSFSGSLSINTSGSFTLEPQSASFSNTLNYPIANVSTSNEINGLTIGKPGNSTDITIGSNTEIAGPISVYGGDITASGNITTTATAGHIKLLARDDLSIAGGITLTTSGSAGDVILAADTDNSSGGAISASGALSISTNGGDIILGGGDTSGSDFTNGEGSDQVGIRITGSVDFDSQGGDIALRGESTAGGSDSAGIIFGSLVDIQSGTGTILIHGINSSSSSDNTNESAAISIVANQNHIIKSLNTTSSAITITADASTSPGGRGLDILNDIDIIASGVGGGVTINGYNSDARTWAIHLGAGSNILANGGDINISSYPDNEGDYGYLHVPGITIGSKASSDVTSSSSNIILTADYFDLDGSDPKLNTSGNVTIQSYSSTWTTFGDRGSNIRISDFTFNDNSGSGEVIGDLTIGKSTNSKEIIVDQSISVTGNVYLLAPVDASTSDVTIESGDTITTTGNNKVIVIAAGDDFDNNSGSSALVANGTGSRWIVYSADDNTSGNFNSLDSNNTAVFGATYSSLVPASVAAGNRYVFAETATDSVLSFVTQDETITYGDSLDLTENYKLNYTGGAAALANVHDGSAGGNSGTISLTTAYSVTPSISISATGSSTTNGNDIDNGTYSLTITVSGGTLKSGYSLGPNSNIGNLTVNPANINSLSLNCIKFKYQPERTKERSKVNIYGEAYDFDNIDSPLSFLL